jgi:biopolymer transport protein TolR
MAMQAGGSEGGLSYDINVTPMIDVLLVLLIIFMITLPLGRRTFDVQVPPEQQTKTRTPPTNQIVLELTADGGYAINKQPVAASQLEAQLHAIFDPRPVKLMFIKAAPTRKYGEVVQAMDIAHGAGVQVIGFTPADAAQAGGGR